MEQECRKEPRHAGSLVVDAGVHAIAGLREILGEVENVYAQLMDHSPATSGPDGLAMQLELSSGAVGHYLACYTTKTNREMNFDLCVYGDAGSLLLSDGKIDWFSTVTATRSIWEANEHDRGYRAQWHNFLRAVRGREPVYSTPAKAYGDLLVLECGLRSARDRQAMSVRQYELEVRSQL